VYIQSGADSNDGDGVGDGNYDVSDGNGVHDGD
jgi:hypothetical protein